MNTPQPSFSVKANEFAFHFTKEEIDNADIVNTSPGQYNLLINNRSVNVVVVATSDNGKKQTIEIDGQQFSIEIKDELDQVLDKMGFTTTSTKQIKEIKAPMPGLVLEIAVTQGQAVAAGEKLLILEAMKMENSIILQADATIKKISVSAGQSVEKGQVLIELE